MKHLNELTGLRCIAVGMVILGHSSSFLPHWANGVFSPIVLLGNGELGVHIFFVLSGFLITSLLIREHERTGGIDFLAFYRRRLLRISPAFYTFLLIMGCLAATGLVEVSWQQFVISGTYIWNYARLLGVAGSYSSHPDGVWYLGHTWSLALEEQFYWIWPAFMWFTIKRHNQWVLPAVILSVPLINIVSYVLFPSMRDQQDIMFHTACDYILVGCFIAVNKVIIVKRVNSVVTNGLFFSILAFVILLVLPNVTARLGGYWSASYGRTIEATLIGLLFLCILSQPNHIICKTLRLRPFVFIGTISYSLYLWQQLFSYSKSPVFFGFPLNIVGAIIVATISYRLVELPFLRLKDRGRRLNLLQEPSATAMLAEPGNTH